LSFSGSATPTRYSSATSCPTYDKTKDIGLNGI